MAGARGEGEYSLSVEPDELHSSHEQTAARVRDVVGAGWRGQAS